VTRFPQLFFAAFYNQNSQARPLAYSDNNLLLRQATEQPYGSNRLAVNDLREQYLKEMALVRQTFERTGDGTAPSGAAPRSSTGF